MNSMMKMINERSMSLQERETSLQDEEWHWIEEAKKGHPLAFEELYKKHSARLFSLCLHFCGSRQDAEEELQEIFIKLIKGLPTFRRESSFSTWAYRIAVNHLSRMHRKSALKLQDCDLHAFKAKSANIHLELVLRETINQLPDKMKKVFILHDRLGFDHEEISRILKCREGTSRSILCRARLGLREKLTHIRKERFES